MSFPLVLEVPQVGRGEAKGGGEDGLLERGRPVRTGFAGILPARRASCPALVTRKWGSPRGSGVLAVTTGGQDARRADGTSALRKAVFAARLLSAPPRDLAKGWNRGVSPTPADGARLRKAPFGATLADSAGANTRQSSVYLASR